MSFNYKKYLASREWAERKEAVKKRDAGRCERCGVGHHESVHHLTYEHIGHEPLEDLQGVCNACHEFLSAKSSDDPVANLKFLVVALPKSGLDGDAIKAVLRAMFNSHMRFAGEIDGARLAELPFSPWNWVPEKYRPTHSEDLQS